MLTLSLWLLGATVVLGLGLSCLYLLERSVRGPAAWIGLLHGLAGAAGTALAIGAALTRPPDEAGLGRIALVFLAAALAAGLLVALAHLRRRKAPGAVIALHATMGIAAYVLLAAYAAAR